MYFIITNIIICYVCYVIWDTYFNRKPNDPPAISKKLPFIGHSLLFIGSTKKLYITITSVLKECMKKGGVAKAKIGFRSIYVVTDPEDCITVSNSCIEKDLIYDFLKPVLGEGLITGKVSIWKRHRKLLNPAFSQPILNSFMEVFNNQSRRLVDQLSEKSGTPFNHEHLLRSNNLETICLTTSGLNCDKYKDIQQRYLTCLSRGLQIAVERFSSFWLHNEFLFNSSFLKRKQEKIVGDFLKLSNFIVQSKKNDIKMNERRTGKVKSFLDIILELSERTGCFTDEEIREETDTILGAGHDTTANTLTTALILLGSHLDVQKKVTEEIHSIFGDTDRDVTKEDLSLLVYTDAVLKETMRLYPIAPIIARYVEREVKLKNCTLQPNSGIFIGVWGLHRDPMWGPDAEEFKPERWLNPDTLPDMNYFGGFGLGNRACIGKVYAMMSMKTVLVHVIRKFNISSDINKMILKLEVMMKIDDGDHVTMSPRKLVFK